MAYIFHLYRPPKDYIGVSKQNLIFVIMASSSCLGSHYHCSVWKIRASPAAEALKQTRCETNATLPKSCRYKPTNQQTDTKTDRYVVKDVDVGIATDVNIDVHVSTDIGIDEDANTTAEIDIEIGLQILIHTLMQT